ncbi:uncharacterized protein LOC133901197 isoform X3 [Phragmites australis]|uniref:uncharacterized protein LOC133901197 isoform X3 n=1 Tax=Phragmites australis TaxID=29695 RepID=UPI002D78E931|nr:uncharacterized protein LOC133901197 isoform X3 [Phragmites australis]
MPMQPLPRLRPHHPLLQGIIRRQISNGAHSCLFRLLGLSHLSSQCNIELARNRYLNVEIHLCTICISKTRRDCKRRRPFC